MMRPERDRVKRLVVVPCPCSLVRYSGSPAHSPGCPVLTPRPAALPPILLAAILADRVTREPGTNKFTVTGIFQSVTAPLPVTLEGFGTYLCVAGLHGPTEILLELLDPDDEPLQSARLTVAAGDPLEAVEIGATCPALTITRSGVHRFRVSAGGEMLAERRLTVVQLPAAR